MNWKKYWLLPFVYMLWVNELAPPDTSISISDENVGMAKPETDSSHFNKSILLQNKSRFEAFYVLFIFV